MQKSIDEVNILLEASSEIQARFKTKFQYYQQKYQQEMEELENEITYPSSLKSYDESDDEESCFESKKLNYNLHQNRKLSKNRTSLNSKDFNEKNSSNNNKANQKCFDDKKECTKFELYLESRERILKSWSEMYDQEEKAVASRERSISRSSLNKLFRKNDVAKLSMIESYKPQQRRRRKGASKIKSDELNIPSIKDFLKNVEKNALLEGHEQQTTTIRNKIKKEKRNSIQNIINDPYHLKSVQHFPIHNTRETKRTLKSIVQDNTHQIEIELSPKDEHVQEKQKALSSIHKPSYLRSSISFGFDELDNEEDKESQEETSGCPSKVPKSEEYLYKDGTVRRGSSDKLLESE